MTVGFKNAMILDNENMVVDDEAMGRPPHTGIQQWASMKQTGIHGPVTNSNHVCGFTQISLGLESSSSHDPQHRTASAYMHIPVTRPQFSDDPKATADASPSPVTWHVPPQQVCKDGAKPTPVCGRYSAGLQDPPKKPKGQGGGPFKCPRCGFGYMKIHYVRSHFPRCVALNGNPDCDAWTDLASYDAGVATKRTRETSVQLERISLPSRKRVC